MAYAALAAEVLAELDAELVQRLPRADADGGASAPTLPPEARRDVLSALRAALARLTSPKVLRGPLDKIAGRVLVWTSNQVTAQAKAAAGIDIRGVMGVDLTADDPALAAQVTAFRAEGVRAIRALGARKIGRVSAILADAGVGTRVEEIAARIRDEAGTSKAHANLLARDQVLKLNASVTQTRHQALGVTEYLWRTSRDERVRARHKELEGTRQAYAAPPVVDLRTGRRAHPGGDFQCRCTAEPIIPDFESVAEPTTRTDTDDFKEGDHPRDEDGKFAEKGGSGTAKEKDEDRNAQPPRKTRPTLVSVESLSYMRSSLERLVDTDIDKYPSRKEVAEKHIRNEMRSTLDYLRMDAKHGSGRHSFEVAAPERIENRGEYLPDGRVRVRRDVCESALRAVQLIHAEKAHEVSYREMSALRTVLHEELHGYSPDLAVGGYVGAGAMIEEGTTEVLARKVLRERFGFEHPTLNVGSDGVYGKHIRRMHGSLMGAMKCTAEEANGVLERASARLKQTPKVSWHPDRVLIADPEDYARLFVRSVVPPDRLLTEVSESSRPVWVARMRETLYENILASATRRDQAMNRIDTLDDELDLCFIGRNQPEVALELLKKRHEHKLLRDEDIKIALKLQDDRATLSSAIRAAGLKPNDPTDDW